MDSMAQQARVIVVGGGLAGLAATCRIADQGVEVDLFSLVPVKRSHSVCAQGGINACNDVARQQGYSEWQHMDETLYGGDFLNHQPPVYEMTHWAPKIIDLLDRMGVPFNRTREGKRDLRLFGGSLFKRTHFAGASTGQQLLYALDEQTRRHEAEGKVTKYEFWEFLWPVLDAEGVCKGIVAQSVRTMEMKTFRADAVVLATGGNGLIFGKSTMSVMCTGGAASRAYQAGAALGNPEMMQVHPTAIPGEDKCRLMSESARGEGGRVWVPAIKGDDGDWKPHPDSSRDPRELPENERWYFLEEKYPGYGNLVPRDIATREIFWRCQEGFGIGGGNMVYLDITHLPQDTKNKLAAILEIYEKFTGDDPREMPMKIFPSIHYSMGGLYTIYEAEEKRAHPDDKGPAVGLKPDSPNNMMTNIKGLYAFGEANYAYHGATRLGANALLSCIFDGLFCGLGVANYVKTECDTAAKDLPEELYKKALDQEEAKLNALLNQKGENNPYELWKELGEEMTAACTVIKNESRMQQAYDKIQTLKERYKSLNIADNTMALTNQNILFARVLGDMLRYAEAIIVASMERKESRGSHYRDDYPERIDDPFHKTAKVTYDIANDKPVLEWEDVPCPLVPPRARTYGAVATTHDKEKAGEAQAEKQRTEPGATGYDQKPKESSPVYGSAVDGKTVSEEDEHERVHDVTKKKDDQ